MLASTLGLNNDHKALMGRIEEGLFAVHEQARVDYMDQDERSVSSADQNPRQPFAKVQFVAAESPAFSAVRKKKVQNRVFPSVIFISVIVQGLQADDRLVAFGSLTSVNFRALTDLALVVNNSDNTSLSIEILRGGSWKRLTLVPKKWSGKGLVG